MLRSNPPNWPNQPTIKEWLHQITETVKRKCHAALTAATMIEWPIRALIHAKWEHFCWSILPKTRSVECLPLVMGPQLNKVNSILAVTSVHQKTCCIREKKPIKKSWMRILFAQTLYLLKIKEKLRILHFQFCHIWHLRSSPIHERHPL